MSRNLMSIGVLFFAIGLGAAALPKPSVSQSPRGACLQDLARYCPTTPFGQGRRLACLAQHKAQLKPACRDKLAVMQSVFEYGKKQQARTEAKIKKMEAEEKLKAAHGQSQPAPASKPK